MGSVVGAMRQKRLNSTGVHVAQANQENGDVASIVEIKNPRIVITINDNTAAAKKSDLMQLDVSVLPNNEAEVTEVTPMGDVASVKNEALLRDNSPAFTERTLTPTPIAAWVLQDIYAMYGAFDSGVQKQHHLQQKEKQGKLQEDERQKEPPCPLDMTFFQLQSTRISQQDLLEQEQERIRRVQEMEEQQVLQTTLRQQQLLQQELRRQELLSQELQQQQRDQEELIRQELETQDEILNQKVKQQENPLTRIPDEELVAPPTKAVSKLKAEEIQTYVDESMPKELAYSQSAQRFERLELLENLQRDEFDDYKERMERLERLEHLERMERGEVNPDPIKALELRSPRSTLRLSRASSSSSSAPFSSPSAISSRSMMSTLSTPPRPDNTHTPVVRLTHDFDPDKFKAANTKNGDSNSGGFDRTSSSENVRSHVSGKQDTKVTYDSEDEDLIDSIAREYEHMLAETTTPWQPQYSPYSPMP